MTWRGIQRREGRRWVEFVDGVQRVLGIELVDGIEGVVRVELVDRICRVAGIILIDGIKRILRIVGIDWIQWIIGTVLIKRVEDVVIACVLLREAGVGKHRSGSLPPFPHAPPCGLSLPLLE